MSERRNLQTYLRNAADNAGRAVTDLHEALDYLEMYEFLQEANPTLVQDVQRAVANLKYQRDVLDAYEVES